MPFAGKASDGNARQSGCVNHGFRSCAGCNGSSQNTTATAASDLQRILRERGETVVDKNNRMKIAGILGVSERTVYRLWNQFKGKSNSDDSGTSI